LFIDILKKYKPFHYALDIGTGSGCIAITLAIENIAESIDAIDKSSGALEVADYNVNQYNAKNIQLINQDFLIEPPDHCYDLIVCNPPYISTDQIINLDKEVLHEPICSLTDYGDGLAFYKKIINNIDVLISNSGIILLEIGDESQISYIVNELNTINIPYKIYKDLQGKNRIIEIK